MWQLLWFSIAITSIEEATTQNPWINGTAIAIEHVPLYKDRILPEAGSKYHHTIEGVGQFWYPKMLPPRSPDLTPDWTKEEIPPTPHRQNYYGEFERAYKLFPFTISASYWANSPDNYDHPHLLGCYCCTVYKRRFPLAGCAVLTTRHILTTATSTELVLKDYPDQGNLEGIIGAYYDVAQYASNNSVHMTPSRIHYHPKYVMPEIVNASHPIPSMFDLAIWAALYPFSRRTSYPKGAMRETYICNRAGSYWLQFGSPTLGAVKQPVAIIVGFQFVLWLKRVPSPFYKYAVKTQKYTAKCPKTEWGWFFCVWGRWAMLGLDSGAALHRTTQGQSWLYDGLLGMQAFSMDLRAKELTHYFTPVENHSVLTFIYDAYMGRLPYRFLDNRYYNSEWKAPVLKPWFVKEFDYTHGPLGLNTMYDPPDFY